MIRAAASVFLIATVVSAQERGPEQVAQAYFQAVQAGDWKRVAAEFTPEAQTRFRSMMVEVLDASPAPERLATYKSFFGPTVTLDQVAALSNTEFVARMLAPILGRAFGPVQLQRVETIGTVTEQPGMAHVVCRMFMGSTTGASFGVERMTVLSVERGPSGWGVALSSELKGVGAMLKAQLAPPGGGSQKR